MSLFHNAVDRISLARAVLSLKMTTKPTQVGTVTLTAGTKAVTVAGGLTSSSVILFSLVTAGGTLGAGVMAKSINATAGTFTAQAIDADGANVATDTSTYAYVVIG